MNDLPRQMLRRILDKYGNAVCGDAKRCENLLSDLCGAHRREINVLVNAIEERVPLDLLAGSRSMPLELLLTRLEKRLEEQTAMTSDAASWAVESWALALNLATEAEIEAREKRAPASLPISNAARTNQPPNSADSGAISNAARRNPVQPPSVPPSAPPPSRVNPPPVIRQPIKKPAPLPPIFSPTNSSAPAAPPIQSPPTNSPPVAVKSFGLFRGCLLVIFLLLVSSVALFFGVPYAIEVMRETQRERNNEPPRFPVR